MEQIMHPWQVDVTVGLHNDYFFLICWDGKSVVSDSDTAAKKFSEKKYGQENHQSDITNSGIFYLL